MDGLFTNQDRGVVLIVYEIFYADDHGASSIPIPSTIRIIKFYSVMACRVVFAECNLKNRNLKHFKISRIPQPWIIDMCRPLT